jgi:hypothetical protein
MSSSDSAGVSLLETVLQRRSDEKGSVQATYTRMVLAFKRSVDIADEVAASFFHQLQTAEPSATGMILLQTKSILAFIECSPESTSMLIQLVQNELNSSTSSSSSSSRKSNSGANSASLLTHAFTDARVVCQVEDCPTRKLFSKLFIESIDPSHTTSSESDAAAAPTMSATAAANEVEGEAPQIISASLAKALITACRTASSELPTPELQNEFIRNLPRSAPSLTGTVYLNDERVAAIATASKLMTCEQWIRLFTEPCAIDGSSETTLPLQPKPVYA